MEEYHRFLSNRERLDLESAQRRLETGKSLLCSPRRSGDIRLRLPGGGRADQAIDNEVADNRRRAYQSFQDIELELLDERERRTARIQIAEQKLAQLRAAAESGNLEEARRIRAEIESLSLDIARTPGGNRRESINIGRGLLGQANAAFEAVAQKQRPI